MKNQKLLYRIKATLDKREEKNLSQWASLSSSAIRKKEEEEISEGHRQNFSVDTDRILHSLAYSRYIDKTQVFYLIKNDHITHRVLHVQLVSLRPGNAVAVFCTRSSSVEQLSSIARV